MTTQPKRQRDTPCKTDGCTHWAYAKGFCRYHYQVANQQKRLNTVCTEPGCTNSPVVAKGLCGTHYYGKRNRDKSSFTPQNSQQCSVDGCTENALSRTYCRNHYASWARHGDPTVRIYKTNNTDPCRINDCTNIQVGQGLCRRHYDKFRYLRRIGDMKQADDYVKFKNVTQKTHQPK